MALGRSDLARGRGNGEIYGIGATEYLGGCAPESAKGNADSYAFFAMASAYHIKSYYTRGPHCAG